MKQQLYSLVMLLWQCLTYMLHKKVFLLCEPSHPNLGDQAQLMCTEKWIGENYKGYKLVKVGYLYAPFETNILWRFANIGLWKFVLLKLFVRKDDVFIGHSGYFFVDHHTGWFSYMFLLKYWKNKMIILPQTINFYTPVVKDMAGTIFSNRDNLTILCRDEVSYKNAQQLFKGTKLILYPDIVTSLVGSKTFNHNREGILFCMRNDIEAHYSKEEIKTLMDRFAEKRKGITDTTIPVSVSKMRKERDSIIWKTIEDFSTYKVVITDRYHGTIFSAIANTPVIVISSADHKLSSGVNWFINEGYGNAVQYAQTLDEAYTKAQQILSSDVKISNPSYFLERYWSKSF